MKKHFNTPYNYIPSAARYEKQSDQPSQTIQGETRTIKQLVERLSMGIPLPNKEPQYMDVDIDEVDQYFQQALDLVDYDELNARIENTRDYVKQVLEEKKQAKDAWDKQEAKKARQLEIEEAVRASKLNAT